MSTVGIANLESGSLAAAIDPRGAQLRSLRTRAGEELLWQGDPAYWPYQAPILFPVIGPLVGGQLRHADRVYPMPPHGFARLRDFTVLEHVPTRCVFELRDDAETHAQYPFAFRLQVSYELSGDSLSNTVAVQNLSDEPLPADIGFHPGFKWPLSPSRTKDEYRIVFAANEPGPIRRGSGNPVLLFPDSRPSPVVNNVLRPRDELFDELALVWDHLNSRSVTFGAAGDLSLRIDFPDSPHLGLWMVPGAPFLCIEPWQGYPSQNDFDGPFIRKPGIALFEPGATREWRLALTIGPEAPDMAN